MLIKRELMNKPLCEIKGFDELLVSVFKKKLALKIDFQKEGIDVSMVEKKPKSEVFFVSESILQSDSYLDGRISKVILNHSDIRELKFKYRSLKIFTVANFVFPRLINEVIFREDTREAASGESLGLDIYYYLKRYFGNSIKNKSPSQISSLIKLNDISIPKLLKSAFKIDEIEKKANVDMCDLLIKNAMKINNYKWK